MDLLLHGFLYQNNNRVFEQTHDGGSFYEMKTIIITFLVTHPRIHSAHKLLELHMKRSQVVRGGGGEGHEESPMKGLNCLPLRDQQA